LQSGLRQFSLVLVATVPVLVLHQRSAPVDSLFLQERLQQINTVKLDVHQTLLVTTYHLEPPNPPAQHLAFVLREQRLL
jgi:ABC-type thiamine transport system ATPase subunit